ncbi:MAG: TorF family putative porin [Proteobacteria bacterium]|nr:TorF family putative porin [Pseudomonadota bacterium]
MNNNKISAVSLGVITFSAFVLSPLPVQAEMDNLGVDVSANVGFVSEYSFRGIAQSDEGPALQGGFDLSHDSGLYAGVWGSNVDFNDGDEASLELDVYAGYGSDFHGLSYDLGVIYYAYPGANSSLNYDFWEGYLALGYDFDVFSTSASVNYSPEYFGDSGDALYYSLGVDVPLPADVTLSGHVGYQEINDNAAFGVPDYMDWSVGLGYSYADFDFSVNYIDTDLKEPSECADGCDSKVIVGISRTF